MIRLLPALTFLLLISATVCGQSPIWVDAFNTSKSGSAVTTHFTIDKDGNSYHGGNFSGTAYFDTFKRVATASDGYIVKTAPNGKTRWAVKLGGTNQDLVSHIATDDSNNVYVTGTFTGTFVLQGSSFTASGFSSDSYLAKFDSSGTVVWIKIATGSSIQQATSVKVDASYNVYWYGQYFGASTIAGRSLAQAGGSYDLFLAKISPSGKPIYVEGYGSSGAETSFDLVLSDKHVYFSGRFFGTFSIGTSSVTTSGSYDVFIVRMDSSLKLSWIQSAGGSNIDDITALSVNSKGEVLFSGTFVSGFSVGSKSVTGSWYDIYVAKLNSSGAGLWVNKISGTGFSPTNYVKGAHIDESGACIIGGYHGTTITIGTTNYAPNGTSDAFVAQYNKNGAFQWINRGGGNNSDLVFGMEVDQTGYYYIGGYYSSKSKFGSKNLTGTGSNVNYTAKGTPPVETPNFKKLRNQYVYVDSTFEKSYDLKLKSAVTYSILRKPSGMTFDADDATVKFTPTLSDVGKHWVVLSAENLGGKDKDSFQVIVITPLKASLALPDTACVDELLAFEQADQSVGPLTVIWDFGDGNSSVTEKDNYAYTSPGQYIVKMYVSNALSVTDSLRDTIQIMPLPTAAFDIAVACINDTMHLIDASTISSGSIDSYEWFENGTSVGVANELKQFRSAAGIYKYNFVATSDASCTDTLEKFVRITAKPVAGFLTYNTCEQDEALFFDLSSATNDTIVAYAWDFGDGTTDTVDYPSFSHTYASAGTYNATLTATTKNGCSDTYTQSVLVNEKPIAKFNLSDLCLGQELLLDDLSTTSKGTIIQRRWSTGDGKSSNKSTLKHTYKVPGTYKVSLVSVNSLNCADTLTEEITVTQKAQVGFTNTFPCVGQNAIFQDTSTTGANDTKLPTKWYVDGNLESTGDFFIKGVSSSTIKVQMVLTTLAGCYDSLEKSLVPNSPVIADFGLAPGCEGDTLPIVHTFDTAALDSTQWIGNGIEVFTENDEYFAYLKSAETESKLFLRTYAKNGCQDSIANPVIVYPAPSSEFSYVIDTPSRKVVFTASATGDNTFTWDFGNGSSPVITKANPVDGTFNVNKNYEVGLKVISDKGCISSSDSVIYIGFPNSIPGMPGISLALYPNPAQNYIVLDMNIEQRASYSHTVIRDMAGHEMLRSSAQRIDVSTLARGSYMVSVEINGNLLTGRFLKQ